MATMICLTPRVVARKTCSLVWAWGPSIAELGGSGDHVLDEVTVSGSVDDGEVELVGVELLVCDIDGNSSLPLLFESVHDPCEVEGSLSFLLCLFLVFLDDVGVDCTGLEQDPSGKGGFSVVDVSDDDQIHVLFLCHFSSS